ncbi:hypothetical protein N9Q77_00805, partial [bacterium]|nr:hypothetical protein [bacterium]
MSCFNASEAIFLTYLILRHVPSRIAPHARLYLRHPLGPHQPLLCCDAEWGVGATVSFIST